MEAKENEKKKRILISQSEIPNILLTSAIRVPQSINENFANAPTKPLRVAEALDMTISSGGFRNLCGASIAYGLTEGGYNAENIKLTELGKRIVSPVIEGDDIIALKEACMKPRIIRDFLQKYSNQKLPQDKIMNNVLLDMGVPSDRLEKIKEIIIKNAQDYGLIRQIKGNYYVDLDISLEVVSGKESLEEIEIDYNEISKDSAGEVEVYNSPKTNITKEVEQAININNNKVFITHGKNRDVVNQLKEILVFGKFEPVVSVETESVSKPVPVKVLDEMRSCYAAIIHVGKEKEMLDTEGNTHIILNPNVLIEIGAAMALFSKRFILLVQEGVKLPSNLQGLYEVRYSGDNLDYTSTMKLLKAFNEFKI